MKKSYALTIFVFVFLCSLNLFAQNTVVCGGIFTDPQGANANYLDNTDYTITIFPDITGEKVTVTFTSFSTENNWDAIYVFDGNSITSPLISSGQPSGNVPGGLAGGYSGTTIPGPFTSTSADGALTFRFRSDSTANNPGWTANVSCAPPSLCATPTNFSTLTMLSGTTLNWTENGNATTWEVFLATAGSAMPNAATTGIITTSKPYALTGLTQESTYNVYVRATCSNTDASTWSSVYNFINTTTCAAPTQILSSNVTSNNANYSWTNNLNAVSYEYAVQPASITTNPTSGTITTTNSVSLTGLIPSTAYKFFVRTICNNQYTSTWISSAFTTTAACVAPTAIVSSNITADSANFAWANNLNAVNYEYKIQLSSLTTVPTSGTITNTNSVSLTGLNPSTTYKFYVRTICNNQYISAWSTSLFATTTACIAPTAILSSNITINSANFAWANNLNAANYEYAVQLSTVLTAPTTGTTISSNSVILYGLNAGTIYKFYVRTICNNQFYSAWTSSQFTTIVAQLQTPICGGIFTDNGGANGNYMNLTNSTVTICPTNPGDVVNVTFSSFDLETSFDRLYVYDGATMSSPQIASSNLTGNLPGAFWGTAIPGPFTSTDPSGCLTFKFITDDIVVKSGWVASVACAPTPTCLQPTSVTKTNLTITSTLLSWTSNANEWEVIVIPSSQTAPDANSVGILTTTKPFVLNNLLNNTSYNAYVRSVCNNNDKSLWSPSGSFTTLACAIPTGNTPTGSNISSLAWSWSGSLAQQYEVLTLPSSAPAPTSTDIGTLVTGNINYSLLNLTCATTYKLYVRTVCTTTAKSAWSIGISYTTPMCILTTGTAQNLIGCADTPTNICLNLLDNDVNILNGLNPNDFTINYYTSITNANNGTNAITTYCLNNTTATIQAVITNITTLQKQTFSFQVKSSTINPTQIIANLDQCDDDQNGVVAFNLTTSAINTSNPVLYYSTLVDATNESNSIANPNVYPVTTASNSITIFARETIIGNCDNIYSFKLNAYADCNIAHNCINANSLCGSLGVPFNNTHQGIVAESGNNYGCLTSTPNPTWFYLPISDAGNINLTIVQNTAVDFTGTQIDVDYIIYGPFTNATTPCSSGLNQTNTVSCSFSIAGIEYPIITNALPGQYYLLMVTNYSNQLGYIKITANPTSTGSIECSGLRLNAYLDSNNSGSQESGESNFPLGQFAYNINGGIIHNITSPSGKYSIYDLSATNVYNLSYNIDPNYSSMYNIANPSFNSVSVVMNAGITTYNFPITANQEYNDLAVNLTPINNPRAGAIYKNRLIYSNLGNQTIVSGTVNFTKDTFNTITSTSEIVNSTPTDFTFNFSNLLPFENRYIDINMQVPAIPTVTIGQPLVNAAAITTPVTENILINNSSSLTQEIIAAYDPNDKIEAHGERILYSNFATDEYLNYTIRFENTGNAAAINVRVSDDLDSKIDETSIKMVSASHNYTLDRVSNNLQWTFDNIQLPPSIANSEIGKGYITFKAKLKPGFNVGTIVPNFANIYFDTNPAITTNTFNTEFVSVLANSSFDAENFGIYPNPASNLVQVKLQKSSENIKDISITDVLGKLVKKITNIEAQQTQFEVSDLEKGVYLLEITTENNLKLTKKLIVK